jgi:hypothetical protein
LITPVCPQSGTVQRTRHRSQRAHGGQRTQQILAGELADVIAAIRGAASSTSASRQSAVTT